MLLLFSLSDDDDDCNIDDCLLLDEEYDLLKMLWFLKYGGVVWKVLDKVEEAAEEETWWCTLLVLILLVAMARGDVGKMNDNATK